MVQKAANTALKWNKDKVSPKYDTGHFHDYSNSK